MKILVVGCGSIGRRHIGNLLKIGGHEIAAVDISKAAADFAHNSFKIPVETILSKSLSTSQIDCVFVATPPTEHLSSALAAAQKGCHIFIEKPLAHSLEGIDELKKVVDKSHLLTMVGCNMRFHPNVKFMKNFIDEGKLGRIYAVRSEVGFYLPMWRPGVDYRKNYGSQRKMGGGVLLDCIHELDYVRWIGGEIEKIQCMATHISDLDIDTEDVAVMNLKFRNGSLGQIHLDYLQHDYSRGAKWIGEKGILVWNMAQKTVRFYDNETKEWVLVHSLPNGFDLNQMYIDEIREFLSAIEYKRQPMSSLSEAERVLHLTLTGKESARWPT